MLDLKQSDLVDTPYLNAQISDSSVSGEDVKSPQNLLEDDHKFYHSMANNEQDVKVKHPYQFYSNYRLSLKNNCVMDELIFSIFPTQV